MPARLLSIAVLLGSPMLVSSAIADSPWSVVDDFTVPLAADAYQRLQTEHYQLAQWNIIAALSSQYHESYMYPTANDVNDAGVHSMDAHKIGLGDFNGDGRQDVIISWATFPHTIKKPVIAPTILLNEAGSLTLAKDIWATEPPARMFAYKVGIADFNQDGIDDAVQGAFGIIRRLDDGSFENTWERIPLMVSEAGKLADYSSNIAGQENGVIDGFNFAHDMAVGDVNADGFFDIYQGRHLLLGDGSGKFTVRNDLIPYEAGPGTGSEYMHYVMSSAIGDLDSDGVDDLVIALADGQNNVPAISGWILLSNGQPNLTHAKKVSLPEGRYGLLNTKHNSMNLADLDGDGRLDIVIGQTASTPYYSGRQLQVLMNRGQGNFVDETDLRVAAANRPDAQGEGISTIMDINGDGYLDIVDSAGGKPDDVAILVNDGSGIFKRMPPSELPIVQNYHLDGNESWEGESFGNSRTGYIYPIDLNGDGHASFLVQMFLNPDRWPLQPGDYQRNVIYTISPRTPFQPVAGPAFLGDTECLFNWGEKIEPSLFPDKNVETQRLMDIQFRHYPASNTYLGLKSNRVLLYQPSISDAMVDLGGVYQYLPQARAAGC